LGSSFLCSGFRLGGSFRSRLSLCLSQKFLANFLRDVLGDRARVGLLLRDSIPRQQINNRLGLDLEFPGQLVDSDLVCFAHASYGPFHGQKSVGSISAELSVSY